MLRLLFIALLGAAPVAAAIWYSWPQLDELHASTTRWSGCCSSVRP